MSIVQTPRQLNLFGLPQLLQNKTKKAIRLNNPTLLLIYLAQKADWVSRSELAFLFRPDDDETAALKQVRLLLYRAKKLDWTDNLDIDTRRAKFKIPTDTQSFKDALEKQNWQNAQKLYTGAFLGKYSSADLTTYNAWLELERSDFETSYKDTLVNYSTALESQKNHEGAAQVLADLLNLDRLNEESLRAFLRNTYLSNRRDKALKAYDSFCEELRREYSETPLEETQELAKLIRNNETLEAATAQEKPLITHAPSLTSKLPAQGTHFVGRQNDLNSLSKQLHDPKCRHISIIGLGGMGKTRLAIALAQKEETSFKDGVYYLELVSLNKTEALINELAQVLGLTLAPQQEPLEQIKSYLKGKNSLLIFDNFEHILEAAPIITDLLKSSTELKTLITSRERLNLQSEWLYDLEGLSSPPTQTQENPESYDAIKLFMNSAKRVAPQLELNQNDLSDVAVICQQVEGSPLAIELAASWVRIMPVERIRQELSENLDLLDSEHSDVAPRHKNMRALWEKTWAQLSEKKRETLAKFTVFKGGSTLEAAEAVTNTHFSVLLSLVNESLLKRIPPNRFDMHELLKQFASTKLTQALDPTKAKHAQIYTELASTNSPSISKEKLDENFLKNLETELANLQEAWWHLIPQKSFKELTILQSALGYMLLTTARYQESISFYQESINKLSAQQQTQKSLIFTANLHSYLSEAFMPLGQWDNAQTQLQAGLELLKNENANETAVVERSNLLESSARIYYSKGQFQDAKEAMLQANELIKETTNTHLKAHKVHVLAIILKHLEDYKDAEKYYHQALQSYKELDDLYNSGLALDNLAALKMDLGELDAAQGLLQEALSLNQRVASTRGEANITYTIGATYYKQKNYPKAEETFLKALKLAEEVTDNTLLTSICLELAKTCLKLKKTASAKAHLLKSADLAQALNSPLQLHEIMLAYSQYLVATKRLEQSLPFLAHIFEHKKVQKHSQQEAQDLKAQLPKPLQKKLEQKKQEPLERLMKELLHSLKNE